MKDSSTFFTKEQRDEILACCFILKADAFGNTSIIANQVLIFLKIDMERLCRQYSQISKQNYSVNL